MYVVAVTLHLRKEAVDAFMVAIQENARLSLANEPDCHRFDVAVGENDKATVFLYELYTDRAGFDAHLATEHFKRFDTMVAPWIDSKAIETFSLVS